MRIRATRAAAAVAAVAAVGLLGQQAATSAPKTTCRNGYVALTIDDGPFGTTSDMLTALKNNRLKATFFVLGSRTTEQPALVARMAREGHRIGNHTWDHSDLTTMTYAEQSDQMARTQVAVQQASGTTPVLFRPTYLKWNDETVAAASVQGLSFSIPTIDTYDWDNATASQIVSAVSTARDGDVIMMHDRYDPVTQNEPVKAVPGIARTLRTAGLCTGFVDPTTGRAVRP